MPKKALVDIFSSFSQQPLVKPWCLFNQVMFVVLVDRVCHKIGHNIKIVILCYGTGQSLRHPIACVLGDFLWEIVEPQSAQTHVSTLSIFK